MSLCTDGVHHGLSGGVTDTSFEFSNSKISALFNAYWDWKCERSPEFATQYGVHQLDYLLNNNSIECIDYHKDKASDFLHQCCVLLQSCDSYMPLKQMRYELQLYIDGHKYNGHYFPLTIMDGFHIDFAFCIEAMQFETVNHFQIYNKRLQAIPNKIQQIKQLMKHGIEENMVLHQHSLSDVPSQINTLTNVTIDDSIWYAPYKDISSSCDKTTMSTLSMTASDIIQNDVIPAFRNLSTFIEMEYMTHCRTEIGVSCLPDGKSFYQQCLHYHTSTELTAQQIHDIGLLEVQRIKQLQYIVIDDTEYKGNMASFLHFLRTDKRFYCKTKEELLALYNEMCFQKIRPKLSQYFHDKEKSKLLVQYCSKAMESGATAFYMPGSIDGTRPGTFQLNGSDLANRPIYEIAVLSLHEAEPGHHFQMSSALHNHSLPMFCRAGELQSFGIPAALPWYTAYLEGWGLYCEYLGEEMGLYEDKYSYFAKLSYEMERACRLVVDTGIHMFGWSFEQACSYYGEYTVLSAEDIKREIKRYISWPGQACGYKIGELKIRELRKLAAEKLGADFDIRDFHGEILGAGAVPLSLLEEIVELYILRTQSNNTE